LGQCQKVVETLWYVQEKKLSFSSKSHSKHIVYLSFAFSLQNLHPTSKYWSNSQLAKSQLSSHLLSQARNLSLIN